LPVRTNPEAQIPDGEKVGLYRSLLNIVAQLNERQYTEECSTPNGRQADVLKHNDLSDPASDGRTSQG
jgi:hypothetical protein